MKWLIVFNIKQINGINNINYKNKDEICNNLKYLNHKLEWDPVEVDIEGGVSLRSSSGKIKTLAQCT